MGGIPNLRGEEVSSIRLSKRGEKKEIFLIKAEGDIGVGKYITTSKRKGTLARGKGRSILLTGRHEGYPSKLLEKEARKST